MDAQTEELDPTAEPATITDATDAVGADVPPDELDDEFAPTARAGLGRLTTALLIGIALVAAFGGGVLVQKNQGGTTAAAGPAGMTRGAFPGGAEGGAFPGGGAAPGADAATGTTGSGATGSGTTGTTDAASTPALIGTVVKVSGNRVTVKNFAGKTVTVTVPDGVKVTKSSSISVSDLGKGDAVTVTGTTGSDGDVEATAVTAR